MLAGEETVGVLGELHPEVAARFDIAARPVYLFELDLERLMQHATSRRQYRPIARFPAVTEDLAVLVDEAVAAAVLEATFRKSPLVVGVRLFDLYAGPPVPAGKKSVAYSVTYQATDHTLSGDEVAATRRAIIERLRAEHGAELRQ